MSGPDTFFASDSLVDLLSEPNIVPLKTRVEIGGVKCLFVSYSSTNRLLKVNIQPQHNPFDIFSSSQVNASIIFPKGVNRKIQYTNYSFKIEQSNDSWYVTIGDKDE